jgi:ribonuclease PH
LKRLDGREPQELRPVRIEPHYMKYTDGSCLIEHGDTKVICTASIDDRIPPWLKDSGSGWVTAEYGMLPGSCKKRTPRETLKVGGRTQEIQRIIGRSLRSVTDLTRFPERTIIVDCDVIQADGGTRTAAITGGYVALVLASHKMLSENKVKSMPIHDAVAAVSVGVVQGEEMLDLCYDEDSQASVDMNVVLTRRSDLVELQGTAEGAPFSRERLLRLLDLAEAGAKTLFEAQQGALGDAYPV